MKKIVTLLFLIFIFLQFFQIEKTNPPVNKGMDFLTIKKTPETIASQIRNSCYDCHSNETKYPWYSYVQPFGWFLQNHIKEGRKELNFSTFATYEPKRQAHKLEEAAEMVEHDAMPLESYLLIHDEAKMTDAQKTEMINYFKRIEEETRVSNNLPEEEPKPEKQ
ncbi:MAG: heme-binding domain-containing protein [Bergeyella sp.]